MPNYEVLVDGFSQTTRYYTTRIEVSAKNEDEAKELAWKLASELPVRSWKEDHEYLSSGIVISNTEVESEFE